ncbi:hypothetical protein [Paenibacillus sp. GCM10028914]|uniref:hypothetical protein n=1 Tax=Paenibacillus sp. GCM10028914 TaxID=3273416 RepID=UPI00360A5043
MTTYPSHQVVYECDQHIANSMLKHKENVHHTMKNAMNRKVRVQTVDHEVIEGIVVGVDTKYVYLNIDPGSTRGFYPGYPPPRPPFHPGYPPPRPPYPGFNPILPLALFNLLTISLLW